VLGSCSPSFAGKYWPNPKRKVLSGVLFAAVLGVPAVFGAQAADAQTSPLPVAGVQQPAAQSASGSATYCKQSSLTGPAFMNLLNTITEHGDLTDIAFLQKTLGTKFILSYEESIPDHQQVDYSSDQMVGAPIHIDGYVRNGQLIQKMGGAIAFLRFMPPPSMMSSSFFVNCMKLTGADFASTFKGQPFAYFSNLSPFIGTASKTLNIPGKNKAKLDIMFSYEFNYEPPEHLRPTPQEALVDTVIISEAK
jgi:hypothetical protein